MITDFLHLEGRGSSRPISWEEPSVLQMLPRPSNRIRKRFACGSVAQSVEQRPFKALVPGSSPGRPIALITLVNSLSICQLGLRDRPNPNDSRTHSQI
jgi:hypothetical protein